MDWYLSINNQNVGPLSEEDIRSRLKTGQLTPATPVWREGLSQWIPLASSPIMAGTGIAPMSQHASYPPSVQHVHVNVPMDDPMAFSIDLSNQEKLMFQTEFNAVRKNATTAVLLALLLGGIGGHKFYMGSIVWGVIYLLFCWTFIPPFIALIECFLLSGQVRTYNLQKAHEIAMRIKAYRNGGVSFQRAA